MARKKRDIPLKKGPKSLWDEIVVPNLDYAIELYSKGATFDKIHNHLGVSKDVWYEGLQKFPEIREKFMRARMTILHEVRGAMISAALGGEREIKEVMERPDGTKIKRIQKIRVEPNVAAGIAILKNAGEWSDNPVVDEAMAETAKTQAELNRRIAKELGLSNPRSNAKDEKNADKNVVSDEALGAMGA